MFNHQNGTTDLNILEHNANRRSNDEDFALGYKVEIILNVGGETNIDHNKVEEQKNNER